MVTVVPSGAFRMGKIVLVLVTVLVAVQDPAWCLDLPDAENLTSPVFEEKLKQMVWKKCSLQVTPTCLKLTLIQLVDHLSEETSFQPLPGVLLSSNRSRALEEANSSRNDLPPQDRLDSLLLAKVKGYLKSLTLSVRLMDAPTLNTTDIMDSVVTKVTGRKKGGVGIGAIGVIMGGGMMTMMLAALAAMAGKALMTAMMALMLAAMSAMKGNGGGGGGGKSTTYEIIAQPHVSHSHSQSSEVQHGHHGWKRSIDQQLAYMRTATSG